MKNGPEIMVSGPFCDAWQPRQTAAFGPPHRGEWLSRSDILVYAPGSQGMSTFEYDKCHRPKIDFPSWSTTGRVAS